MLRYYYWKLQLLEPSATGTFSYWNLQLLEPSATGQFPTIS
jgi:hypothetical protein